MTHRHAVPWTVAVFAAALIWLGVAAGAGAEATGGEHRPFAVGVWPAVTLPLGLAANAVDAGLSGDIGLHYRFAVLPLYAGLEVSYARAGLGATGSIASLSAFGSLGARFALMPWLHLVAGGFVGAGRSALVLDEAEVAQIAVGLRAGYLAHANTYHGLRLAAGTVVSLPGFEREPRSTREPAVRPAPMAVSEVPAGSELAPHEIVFDTVFPVFYKYYDANPVGRAVFTNRSSRGVSGITIRLMVPRYMDVAKTQEVPGSVAPGEEIGIDLYVLLTDEVLRVTEGTKAAVRITVEYVLGGERRQYTLDRTLDIANRNAMTWDDDRKAASFVTAKDPVVLTMAKNVAAVVRGSGLSYVS